MEFDYSQFFREEEDHNDELLEQQYQEFFEVIRIYLIIVLILTVLCFISNAIISKYRNRDLNSEVPSTRQDRLTYYVAVKLCMFGLAIALAIGLLLPMTIISNEILLIYPEDQYPNLQWLNDKLIKQLWHCIFIFSNLCFILIPFSYFFAESTGFSRSTDNFFSRILQAFLETTLTLTILSSCIFIGLSSIFPILQPNFLQLITFWLNFPFLYSCISFAGAILLLVCTPKGILNLVIFLDEYMTRPYSVNSTVEKYDRILIKETVLLSRQELLIRYRNKYGDNASKVFSIDLLPIAKDIKSLSPESLIDTIEKHENQRQKLFIKLSVSWIRSKIPWLMYPLAMALLILTTAFSCAIVLINLLVTLFNFEDTSAEPLVLGIASFSKMGLLGASVQTLLIFYIWCASLVGLYSLPGLACLRPIPGQTPFFKIMLNCLLVLVLSSALPIFFRTVGITNFDLFGSFGQIVWIRNYHLVLSYNGAFLGALTLCLCHSIVLKLSKEFFYRCHRLYCYLNELIKSFTKQLNRFKTFCEIGLIPWNRYHPEQNSINPSNAESSSSFNGRIKSFYFSFRNIFTIIFTYLISLLQLRKTIHSAATSPITIGKKLS
ncbi:LMBR1L-like protein [Euroglyphus maynei]|uniref:LMBR1L-like protein n=1 Tax=Euroglyphus maynei TaxID=6958 RepID=A0A1Y3AQS5_EURMA|nr:LMBR1L-like protein [Euroglyphus maynei]